MIPNNIGNSTIGYEKAIPGVREVLECLPTPLGVSTPSLSYSRQ